MRYHVALYFSVKHTTSSVITGIVYKRRGRKEKTRTAAEDVGTPTISPARGGKA